MESCEVAAEGSDVKIHSRPSMLYKYRNWTDEKHRRILTHDEIFFASPKSFNDPFDCRIKIRYDLMPEDEILRHHIEHLKETHPYLRGKRRKQRAKQQARKSPWRDPDKIGKLQELMQYLIDTEFGVFSLTENRESLIMWAHYASSHQGFCVGFDVYKLGMCMHEISRIRRVEYVREYLRVLPDYRGKEDLEIVLTTKGIQWIHEQEWRVVLLDGTNKAIPLPEGTVKEVILGCRMPERQKDEMVGVLRRKRERVHLMQARKREYEFGLTFEELTY